MSEEACGHRRHGRKKPKAGKAVQAQCGSVFRRAFHCWLRQSLLPPRSCFQLFPKREGFGQIAMCSHPGVETREGALAERGSERRSVGTAPAAVGARQALRRGRGQRPWPGGCPSAAASRVLAPGSSRDAPSARRKGRQRKETTLPGEDDTALPEALSYFMPGIYRSPGIPFALSALTPQTNRGALRCRRCPLRPAPAVPVQRWLPGRQRRSAVPTPGAERASPRLLMGGNF